MEYNGFRDDVDVFIKDLIPMLIRDLELTIQHCSIEKWVKGVLREAEEEV